MELNDRDQADASRRQQEIRSIMDAAFDIEHDFLTGSYIRWTKTKPLKDVDIFCVLGDAERHYRDKSPAVLLAKVEQVLIAKYGRNYVSRQRHSVTLDFGIKEENGETGDKVMSFDVVPALAKNGHYEIPDTGTELGWTETDPRVHADLATAAHAAFAKEWKGLVRMMKSWNRYHDKPIKPSFLIEVMALDVLHPPFGGDYRREVQAFFATLADRIYDRWPDPAGLGPDVSDRMDVQQCQAAQAALLQAEQQVANAIQLEKHGKQGEALRAWQNIFGPLFPLS